MRKLKFFSILFVFIFLSFQNIVIAPVFCHTEVLFSPDDKPAEKLIKLIDEAKVRVHVAVFWITSKKIVDALIRAKKRNVDVQIITDQSGVNNEYSRIQQLFENKIPIFVFKTNKTAKRTFAEPKMHNKFAIIDDKIWTGSFNWTHSANFSNQENVVLIDKRDIVLKYEKQFKTLKNRSFEFNLSGAKNFTQQSNSTVQAKNKLKEKIVDLLKAIRLRSQVG